MSKLGYCSTHGASESCVYCIGKTKTKSCKCLGNNENCIYCSGSGIVRSDISLGQQRLYSAGAMKSIPPKKHKENDEAQISKNKSREKKQIIVTSTYRFLSESEIPKIVAVKAPESQIKLISCEYCNAKVRETRYKSHVKKKCPQRPRFQCSKIAKSKTRHMHINKTSQQHDSYEENNKTVNSFNGLFDKNMDATKDYAHAYRENGRYGSHASHDGFDDESSP